MAALLGMLQRERELRDTPEQALADALCAAFERESLAQPVGNVGAPDVLYRLTSKTAGITTFHDRYAFVCGRHLTVRAESADPADLGGFVCDECEAHRAAAAYRLRFRELLKVLRHG